MAESNVSRYGRVVYVDPNNKRMDSPDNAIENPYEDYSIFINLDVIRYDRRRPGNQQSVDSYAYKTNFMPGTNGYLSTSFTDISPLRPGEGNSETLGITSIDISYQSWFYPEVTITFVDVRGSALMAPQDKALYDTELYEKSKGMSITERNTDIFGGSIFKSLFTFPYPEFRLTVKGFYGKPVVLRLCVSKMNIKMNSSTGNFELVVSFIGSMYGMYTDIPLHLLTIAPYTDPVPGELFNSFWKNGTSGTSESTDVNSQYYFEGFNGEFQKPMMTFAELNAELKKFVDGEEKMLAERPGVTDTYSKLVSEKDELQKIIDTNPFYGGGWMYNTNNNCYWRYVEAGEQLNDIVTPIGSFVSKLDAEGIDVRSNAGTLGVEYRISSTELDADNYLQTVDEYTFGLAYDPKHYKTKTYRYRLEAGNTIRLLTDQSQTGHEQMTSDGFISLSSNDVDFFRKTVIQRAGKNKKRRKEDKNIGIIAFNVVENINNALSEKIREKDTQIASENDVIKQVRGMMLRETLGFNPSVHNIFKLVYAHLDVFAGLFYRCLDNVTQKTMDGKRKVRKSSTAKMDFMPLGVDEFDMPPFAMFYGEKNDNGAITYDAFFPSLKNLRQYGFSGLEEEPDEAVLVRQLLAGAAANVNHENELSAEIERLAELNNPEGTVTVSYDATPITPFDFIHKSPNQYLYLGSMASDYSTIKDIGTYAFTTFATRIGYLAMFHEANTSMLASYIDNETNMVFSVFGGKDNSLISSIENVNVNELYNKIVERGIIEGSKNLIPVGYSDLQKLNNRENIANAKNEGLIIDTYDITRVRKDFSVFRGNEYNGVLDSVKSIRNEKGEWYERLLGRIYKGGASPLDGSVTTYSIPSEDRSKKRKEKDEFFMSKLYYSIINGGDNSIGVTDVELAEAALAFLSFVKDGRKDNGFVKNGRLVPSQNGVVSICSVLFEGAVYYAESETEYGAHYYTKMNATAEESRANVYTGNVSEERKERCKEIFRSWFTITFSEIVYKYTFLVPYDEDSVRPWNGTVEDFSNTLVNENYSYGGDSFVKYKEYKESEPVEAGFVYYFMIQDTGRDTTKHITEKYDVVIRVNKPITINGVKYSSTGYYIDNIDSAPIEVELHRSFWGGGTPIRAKKISKIPKKDFKNVSFNQECTDSLNEMINERVLVFDAANFDTSRYPSVFSDKAFLRASMEQFKNMLLSKFTKSEFKDISQTSHPSEAESLGEDFELSLYITLANLYKKWLCGKKRDIFYLTGEKSEFKRVNFIDGFYNRIGHDLMLGLTKITNIMSAYILSENQAENATAVLNKEYSVLQLLSILCQENDMTLYALPCEFTSTAPQIEYAFTPFPYNEARSLTTDTTSYVCVYTSKPSENLDKVSEYENDGLNIAGTQVYIENSMFTEPMNGERGLSVPAFGVNYAKQNQSFFRDVTLSMDNAQTTNYSIMATLNIAGRAGEAPKAASLFGQDIYRVYSNYSYNCDVEMMGCMQIMPLMYFQLNNVPMWKGAYMISKVSHKIRPGMMTTNFTGYRVSKYRIPLADGTPTYPVNIQLNSVSSDYRNFYTNGANYGVIYHSAGVAWPQENYTPVRYDDYTFHNLIYKTGAEWESETKAAADYVYRNCPNPDPNHHLCARYTYNIARRLLYSEDYKCGPNIFSAGGNANQPGYWNNLKAMGYRAFKIIGDTDPDFLTYDEVTSIIGRANLGKPGMIQDAYGCVAVFFAGGNMHTQIYCGTDIKNNENTLNNSVERDSIQYNKANPWVADNVYGNRIPYKGPATGWTLYIFVPPSHSSIPPISA